MKTEDAVRALGGVWPSDNPKEVYLYQVNGRYSAGVAGGVVLYVCTRHRFEECTRQLRNEPSWDDAPDWAVAKAQDSTGRWHWYSENPSQLPGAPGVWGYDNTSGRYLRATQGEVIGDWRDTLRLRPEEEKVDTADTLLSSYRKALEKVLDDSECGVVPKSHLDDIEGLLGAEQMRNKRDWYKKGELPPVGTVCRLRFATITDTVVTITYIGDGVLCYRDEQGMEYSAASRYVEFRPLQTERERWVAAAQKAIGCEPNAHRHMLGQLYDAGLAKMPEDE